MSVEPSTDPAFTQDSKILIRQVMHFFEDFFCCCFAAGSSCSSICLQ
jgi:hypothetical protein